MDSSGMPQTSGNEPRRELLAPADHQRAATEITEAFIQHDQACLAQLTATERADQVNARLVLESYLTAIWEAPKIQLSGCAAAGALHPGHDPAFSCVAGLRDLVGALVEQASKAQADARDDVTDHPCAPRLSPSRFAPCPRA